MPAPRKFSWPLAFAIWTGIGLILLIQTIATVDFAGVTEAETRMNYWTGIYLQMTRAWLWCLLTPLVFELRRRIPFHGWLIPWGVFLHVAFASCLIVWIIQVRFWGWMPISGSYWEPLLSLRGLIDAINSRTLIDVMLYIGIVGVGYTLDLNAEKKEAEQRAQELRLKLTENELQQEQLRSELVQAEMKALKQQLHPHFLFNALNAVSGLVRQRENQRAVEALSQVSSLLRALIGSTGRAEVTLEEEIQYCDTYLLIEKLRFDQRLNYQFDIAPEALGAEVPTLLLQPMVENAIKHGIACRRNPGWVRVAARIEDNRLRVEVVNDPAEVPRGQTAPASHGVGLATTRKRLEKVYGTAYRLDCSVNTPRGTVVVIEIPLVMAEANVPVRV